MKFEKISFMQWKKDLEDLRNSQKSSKFYESLMMDACDTTENTLRNIWENIKLPKRATVGSAGYDFFMPKEIILYPGQTMMIPTAMKWNQKSENDVSYKYFLAIYPRSSLGRDYSLREPNTVSIIDADYYGNTKNDGHIFITLKNEGTSGPCVIKQDMAYAQGIIQRFFLTEDDTTSDVRKGGFGSTDKSL